MLRSLASGQFVHSLCLYVRSCNMKGLEIDRSLPLLEVQHRPARELGQSKNIPYPLHFLNLLKQRNSFSGAKGPDKRGSLKRLRGRSVVCWSFPSSLCVSHTRTSSRIENCSTNQNTSKDFMLNRVSCALGRLLIVEVARFQ